MTKSVNVLLRNLFGQSPDERSKAAMDLGEMGAVEAVDSLVKVLQNDDESTVRSVCAEALGTIAVPETLPELVKALEEETDDTAKFSINWAIDAIARKIGKPREEAIEEYSNIRSGVIDRHSGKAAEQTTTKPKVKATTATTKEVEVEPEEAVENLRKIMTRYESITIEKMAKLLEFEDTISLEKWLLDLPDELAFRIEKDEIIFPEEFTAKDDKAEKKIAKLLETFENYLEE